jgi:hypothetical protein
VVGADGQLALQRGQAITKLVRATLRIDGVRSTHAQMGQRYGDPAVRQLSAPSPAMRMRAAER